MLLFSTILNIDKSLTKDDFLNLVIEWNQGSPHENNVIPNLNWDGSYNKNSVMIQSHLNLKNTEMKKS